MENKSIIFEVYYKNTQKNKNIVLRKNISEKVRPGNFLNLSFTFPEIMTEIS